MIGLTCFDREILYNRINRRVDKMLEEGLVEEARDVYENYHLKTAFNAIGYKELIPYFNGECSLEEAADRIKQETRRYAKRRTLHGFVEMYELRGSIPQIVNNLTELLQIAGI